ncbi:RNA-directed RNA polymerase [ssRNA phage Gerhypos.4_54]|uniref:RNA-directed RNA polymerase n=2 Tax=Leviviricetes TaxID=2842243 RepID=A0A8S5L1L7_9VIRU|nr:RNA-directed RNA polymerase [ssRNA phage Gerhypos.4_54]QDH88728.1 MAG: RNA-dependent RNA polymerase [Leviviridae sp.]DAD51496.1 TPA_asm: RNA-directed RNA polymerase [ssRNA phage Gerhypos.4_54]
MKSLMLFLQSVLTDVGTLCCVSTSRDLETITARVKHEGLSFLTITLPSYGKDFERSLDLGYVADEMFLGFKTYEASGLPRLFEGFLQQVFDFGTGRLLDEPSIDAIFAVRQLTLLFGKIELECSDERKRAAIDSYVECEKDMDALLWGLSDAQLRDFRRVSELLWRDIFTDLEHMLEACEVVARFSGGSTADKLSGNRKYDGINSWPERAQSIFPWEENLYNTVVSARADRPRAFSHLSVGDRSMHILEPGTETPVKVVLVPKTMKTPRVIAMEPTCMQFMQQGLLRAFSQVVQANDSARALVGWQSQEPNRSLARSASHTGKLATLDLSEASDRVSNLLVIKMFGPYRLLAEAVQAVRSNTADVPGYGVLRLAKYASMGSALTFPLESLVFMTIVFLGIEQELNRPLSKAAVKRLLHQVRTFGDDIIVPTRYTRSVIGSLEAYGLKVNTRKSFWTGKFRESCGGDYYDGEDVTVTRCRALFPTSRSQVPELVSTVALRNLLYKAGLWNAVRFLDEKLEGLIPFPAVEETSSVLGKFSFLGYSTDGWNPDLQRPFVRGAVLRPVLPTSRLDGYGALLKFFLTRGDSDIASEVEMDLEHGGRPVVVDIKLRKACPF